jgi:hypothetical protein
MFGKIFEKENPKKKDKEIDLSKRKFLKDAGKVVLVATGAALMGPKLAFGENKSEKERDYSKDFDIGVEISDKDEDIDKIINYDNQFDVETISGGSYYNLDSKGLPYKRRAFAQMIVKYGKERVQEFLDLLVSVYPSNLEEFSKGKDKILTSYGRELPRLDESSDEASMIRLNKKLFNISDSLEKGELEKLDKLFKLLKDDGYDKKYDFNWNKQTINRLLSDEEERKSMIEFQNAILDGGKGGVKYIKLKNFLGEDRFDSMTFKEKLEVFKSESIDKL